MRLWIRSTIPDRAERISLYECEKVTADGAISYKPTDHSDRVKQPFCFDHPNTPHGAEIGRASRTDTAFEVCMGRETGFCASDDCLSVFVYDQCAAFDDVVECSHSLDCPMFERDILEFVPPNKDDDKPVMDLIHEVNPEVGG